MENKYNSLNPGQILNFIILELHKELISSKDFLENFAFDNGGLGCECCFIAEGKDIAEAAIEFFNSHFELYDDEDDYETKKNIIEEAQSHPDDCEKVLALINLISDQIDDYLRAIESHWQEFKNRQNDTKKVDRWSNVRYSIRA